MAGLMRTSNPALNEKAFQGQVAFGDAMTLQGTVNKTGLLLLCVVATAAWTWGLSHSETPQAAIPWMIGGLIGGFVVALVTIFKQTWAPFTAPLYALLEGLALGGISAVFEKTYHGIAIQAVGLTFGVLFVMLLAYKTGLIRATQGFKVGVIAATGGIVVFYIVEMALELLFSFSICSHQRRRLLGHRFQPVCGRDRRAESRSRFRHDRDRRARRRSEVYGVVRRFRHDGHAGLALFGNSAPACQSEPQVKYQRGDRT